MSRSRIRSLPLLLLVGGLALSGCAPAVPVVEDRAGWRILGSADDDNIVVQQRLAQGLVSVMCERVGCHALIVTDARCIEEGPLPVLINSAVETRVTDGRCLAADAGDDAGGSYGAILLDEDNLLLANIVLGDDAAIAVPMADGRIRVFNVAMGGLRDLLESHQPGGLGVLPLPDDPRTIPDPGTEPFEQNEADRWRRGLQAI
ncbi:MAG: hypothetical protein R3E68_22640 [Burkholderiaceae bacterium]